MNPYYFVGGIMVLLGIVINMVINRRRFYRRGPGGLQHFKSYSQSVFIGGLEKLGKLLAILLIICGVLFLLTANKIYNVSKPDIKNLESSNRNAK